LDPAGPLGGACRQTASSAPCATRADSDGRPRSRAGGRQCGPARRRGSGGGGRGRRPEPREGLWCALAWTCETGLGRLVGRMSRGKGGGGSGRQPEGGSGTSWLGSAVVRCLRPGCCAMWLVACGRWRSCGSSVLASDRKVSSSNSRLPPLPALDSGLEAQFCTFFAVVNV
jgi:hypothetical protein